MLESMLVEYFPLSIEKLINRKGLEISNYGREINLNNKEGLFVFLKSYHFRRTLHDILTFKTICNEQVNLLVLKWGNNVPNYLSVMEKSGIIVREGNCYKAQFQVSYLGNLLEWSVGKFLSEELGLETKTNVRLKDLRNGGDIDIISRLETKLIMFECKESPPNNVPYAELSHICKRMKNFKPDIFLLLIDTTLSIKRNIVDNLSVICKTDFTKLREGIYVSANNFFIVTAKRDLFQNVSNVLTEDINGIR